MIVKNLFRVNDWKLTEFLVLVFSVQFGLLGLALLGAIGFQVPLVRPVLGFVYLTFVPGALLLRALRIHGTSGVETVLYAAGLSLAFDMLVGLLMNALYPCVGVDAPIAEVYIVLTMAVGVFLLAALCYFRDRDQRGPTPGLEIDGATLAPALFLVLVPLVSAAGSYAVNAYGNDILVYVALLAVAAVAVLCGFGRIPERLYPLAIVSVAAALMFQNGLISDYLSYWDGHFEYNIANLVIASGHWDTSIASTLNAMLSIVFLEPFYFHVCDLDLTWVFKLAIQLIFCLVPLGLYIVYARQAGGKVACLACLFFMFMITFFTEMHGLTRQEVAELFLVLILMLVTDAGLDRHVRMALMVIFGVALILSHYGLAYIYLLVFLLSLATFQLVVRGEGWIRKARRGRGAGDHPTLPASYSLTLAFVGTFACFLFFWYMYAGGAMALNSIAYILYKMLTSVTSQFLNPEHVQGLSYVMKGFSSPLYELKKYLHLAFQGLIALGFLAIVLPRILPSAGKKAYNFNLEYTIFSFINLLICLGGIALPYFASSLNTSRLYQITLIVLSPLCIIAGLALIKAIAAPLRTLGLNAGAGTAIKVMSVALVVYLSFNSGLVFNLFNDHPMSLALSASQINGYSLNDRAGLYDALNTFEPDYYGTTWLSDHRLDGQTVYSDYISFHPISGYGNVYITDHAFLQHDPTGLPQGALIYLGYANIKGGVFKEASGTVANYETGQVLPGLGGYDEVYENGGSIIYDVP